LDTTGALTNTGTLNVGGVVTVGSLAESQPAATGSTTPPPPVLNFVVGGPPSSAHAPMLHVQGSSTLAGVLTASTAGFGASVYFTAPTGASYSVATFGSAPAGAFSSTSGTIGFAATVSSTSIVLNNAGLQTSLFNDTFPQEVATGYRVRGTFVIDVTNATEATIKGPVKIKVFVSSDGAIDGSSTLVLTTRRIVDVKSGKTVEFDVATPPHPAPLTNNITYTYLSETIIGGIINDDTIGSTIDVSPPLLDLSAQVSGGAAVTVKPGKAHVIKLYYLNDGNIATTGAARFDIGLSTDGGATEAVALTRTSRIVRIGNQQTVPINIRVVIPAHQAPGTYTAFLRVTQDGTAAAIVPFSIVVV
jgi:hypothetical protein